MKHLKQAINLFGQRYNPHYHRKQLVELEDELEDLTNNGNLDEDDLTTEEFKRVEELQNAIIELKEIMRTKGEGLSQLLP